MSTLLPITDFESTKKKKSFIVYSLLLRFFFISSGLGKSSIDIVEFSVLLMLQFKPFSLFQPACTDDSFDLPILLFSSRESREVIYI